MRGAWARRIAFRLSRGAMITIEFTAPSTARIQFEKGDRLSVRTLTPELKALIESKRLDGHTVARITRRSEDEVAVTGEPETAAIRHGRVSR